MPNRAIDRWKVISEEVNEMFTYTAALERDVANLKKVIKIMASSEYIDQEGNVSASYTPQEADFIKRVVEENNVFTSRGLK